MTENQNLPDDDLEMAPDMERESRLNDMLMSPYPTPGKWNDGLPEELERFFVANDIPEKFSIILEKYKGNECVGSSVKCMDFTNQIPTSEYIAQVWGPGCYRMAFSYRKKLPNGQRARDTTMKPHYLTLGGDYYEKLFEEYQENERDRRLERMERRNEERAIKDKYRFGGGDPLNSVAKSIEALAPILQLTKQDNSGTTELLKALIVANTSKNDGGDTMKMMMLMMNQQAEASRNQTAMLLGLVQTLAPLLLARKENADSLGGAGSLDKILSIAERIQGMINPPVKTFADRIFDMLEEWAPAIMKIVQTPPAERGMMDRMLIAKVKKSQELARLAGERESLIGVVNKMDERFGTKIADQILSGLGFTRPEETAGNYQKFPAVTAEAEEAAAEGEAAEGEDAATDAGAGAEADANEGGVT